MKRKRYVLTCDYFDEHDIHGYRLQGMRTTPNIAPISSGTQLAHDIVEHVNGLSNIGDPLDEIEALGMYLNIRYYVEDVYDMYDAAAHDILNIAQDAFFEYDRFYLKRKKLLKKDSFLIDMFEAVKDRILKIIRTTPGYYDSDFLADLSSNLPDFFLTVRNHLINGAVKGERKYGSFINAASLYESIKSASFKDKLEQGYKGISYKIVFYVENYAVTDVKIKEDYASFIY